MPRSLNRFLFCYLFIFLCTPLAHAKAESAPQKQTPATALTWNSELGKTAVDVVENLESRHYLKQKLDDKLSAELLDNYLKSLDPAHMFLLQSDIDSFARYRTTLDNTLDEGNLEPAFAIFRTYNERMKQRLEKLLAELPANIAAMDFTKNEFVELNRDKNSTWPKTKAEADELWRLHLKSTVLGLRLAGKKSDDIVKLLEKRYRNQLNRAAQITGDDVFQIYMNALGALYDPHTNYFSPRTSENFNINMSLKLEGIGAVLQQEDEHTKVMRVLPASPADKQGELKAGDRIVGVSEAKTGELLDVVGWRLDDVVDLIRGPKGTTVRLEIIPSTAKSDAERKQISIVRNEITLEEQSAHKSIETYIQNGRTIKIGVINIPAFYIDFEAARRGDPDYKSTTRDVQKLLSELIAEDVDGVMIDLRENGGGSLQEANQLIGLFIEQGPTVQIRQSSSSMRAFPEGKPRSSAFYDGPLAVVINRLSASASEIFAGAIQDYQRGLIIGDRTFGKGTVQQLMELNYGELKMTQSKFYRVSGDSTQNRGVLPDVTFPSLYDTTEVGESALDKAMPWDRIPAIQHRVYFDIQPILPSLQSKHDQRVKTDPDFVFVQQQITMADGLRKHSQLSLNEAVRKKEIDENKAKRLEAENQRRIAKGEKPLDKLDDKDDDDDTTNKKNKDKDKEPDAFLREAGRVLVDSMPIFQKNRVAERLR
ncbi:MAG: carboxy terminal-processing peptidase [Spongiibacteraceae bacterium]